MERITIEMLEDFERDGVVYLEVRTTPKAIGNETKRDYIDAVLRGMKVISAYNHSLALPYTSIAENKVS